MDEKFYKKRLKNGLTVLFEKRNLPVISTVAGVKFGSQYESESVKGIAHFIEHLLFKGTKKRSYDKIAKEIEKKGGILNGYTSDEATVFWNKLPDEHADTGIEISSDLILNPAFKIEEFEKEKQVVIEEIKMYHDNPVYYVLDKIKSLLYNKPFGMSGAGTIETVQSLTREKVVEFFNKHYRTNKMILCCVGNSDFDFICKKAEKIFPKSKTGFKTPIIKKINNEILEKRKGIDQAHFIFALHSPTLLDNSRYTHALVMTYLAGGMSGVLFDEIREKRGLAYTVKSDIDLGRDYGYTMIYTGTQADKIKDIKEIIIKEMKNIKNMKQRDLSEAKEQMIGLRKVEEEDSTKVMNALFMEEIGKGAEEYYKFEDRINALKLQNVRNMKLESFSSLSLVPG